MIPPIDFLSAESLLPPTADTGVEFCLIGHSEGPRQLSIDSADYRGGGEVWHLVWNPNANFDCAS